MWLPNSHKHILVFCQTAWEQTDKGQVTKWKFLNPRNTHRKILIRFALLTWSLKTTQNVQGNKLWKASQETRFHSCCECGLVLHWGSLRNIKPTKLNVHSIQGSSHWSVLKDPFIDRLFYLGHIVVELSQLKALLLKWEMSRFRWRLPVIDRLCCPLTKMTGNSFVTKLWSALG